MPPYLSCPLCLKSTLSDVQELQKNIASSLSRSLHCPICSAALNGLQSLHYHLATHIPIPPGFQALSLPASPDQIPSLEKLDIRDDQNSPKLDSSSSTQNDVTMNDDNSSHVMPAQCNCEFCGLIFSSEYFLTLHKDIMHSDVNGYEVECKQCKSRFKKLEVYRDHVKEMHSDRRYICDHCPKSFKIKGGLLVHTRMFHDQSSPSTCQVCKKNFTSKARKELHEKRYHSGKPPIKSCPPKLNRNESGSDLGEAKTNLENLIQETNHINSLGSPEKTLIEAVAECVTPLTAQNISVKSITEPIVASNLHLSNIKSHQAIGRQVSCPSLIFSNKETEKEDKNRSKKYFTNNYEVEKNVHYLQQHNSKEAKTTVNSTEVRSPTLSALHFNNLSYSFPKLNDIQLSNFLPISNFTHPDSLNAQTLLSNSNYLSFPDINKNRIDNTDVLQKTNNIRKSTEQSSLEPQNNYLQIQHPLNILNELSVAEPNLSCTDSNIISNNNMKVTSDYSLVLPSNVNMSYLINAISTPSNLINKMKDSLEKLSSASEVGKKPDTDIINQAAGQKVEIEKCLKNKETQKKTQKLTVKKNNFSNRGTETKQWVCEECKKCFTTKYFLKKHKRLHTGETPYTCEECGKTFTFQQSYHKHVFYHSDDKPHICPHCHRAFKEMSTLHNHVRIHTGEKPFVCSTCGKAFRQRVSYLVHQRIHTGILPYRCDVCGRSFRYKVSLRSHKCEGKSPKESKDSDVTDVGSASSKCRRSEVVGHAINASSGSRKSKEKLLDQLQHSPSQESSIIKANLSFEANMQASSSLEKSSGNVSSSNTNEIHMQSFPSFNKSSVIPSPRISNAVENGVFKSSDSIDNISITPSFDHLRSSETISSLSRAVIAPEEIILFNKNQRLKSAIPSHVVNKLPIDNGSFHSTVKFDDVSIPNLNITDHFSSVNLDDDLDNDSFIKSLFS